MLSSAREPKSANNYGISKIMSFTYEVAVFGCGSVGSQGFFIHGEPEQRPRGGGGGTWPMFGYRGAAEGLKSWPCLGQKYAKNPTQCRTTASISIPCLGQVTNAHRLYLQEFKLFKKSFKSEKSCSMGLNPSFQMSSLHLYKGDSFK